MAQSLILILVAICRLVALMMHLEQQKDLGCNPDDPTEDEAWQQRAYVHSGERRSFTINKRSISSDHNIKETYRRAISLLETAGP